ncbi:hypothetical protein CCP3SC15_6040002 [Gammaproteobacteria bacterium]
MADPYYQYHVFFCTNLRENGMPCCGTKGAQELRDYAKQRVKALESSLSGKMRVNSAGCLDRCAKGPVLVIYPEGVWYTYTNREDIDEIIEEHLVRGRVLERLTICVSSGGRKDSSFYRSHAPGVGTMAKGQGNS